MNTATLLFFMITGVAMMLLFSNEIRAHKLLARYTRFFKAMYIAFTHRYKGKIPEEAWNQYLEIRQKSGWIVWVTLILFLLLAAVNTLFNFGN